MTKVMVTGDYHIPFLDLKAYEVMKKYMKEYKPDVFVINGDFLDFYGLSEFSKNPMRKKQVSKEIKVAKEILKDIMDTLPNKTKVILIEGNHENRLQRFVWRNEALFGLESLTMQSILDLKKYKNITYVECDRDYWSSDRGTYQLGDILIMHGDSRLNGASYSKFSGYSIKNTMYSTQMNTIMGHIHRLAQIYVTNPHDTLIGLEGGCLCYANRFNWQQGFITFELKRGKTHNHRLYHIIDGSLLVDGKEYKSRTKKTLLKEA